MPVHFAEQAADAVRELLAEAATANTTRSYATPRNALLEDYTLAP